MNVEAVVMASTIGVISFVVGYIKGRRDTLEIAKKFISSKLLERS